MQPAWPVHDARHVVDVISNNKSNSMADTTKFDSDFLKATVGDALAKGVAATVEAQPDDPVEYLARYLLRYVLVGICVC